MWKQSLLSIYYLANFKNHCWNVPSPCLNASWCQKYMFTARKLLVPEKKCPISKNTYKQATHSGLKYGKKCNSGKLHCLSQMVKLCSATQFTPLCDVETIGVFIKRSRKNKNTLEVSLHHFHPGPFRWFWVHLTLKFEKSHNL